MIAKRAQLIGWTLIGVVTALSFILDHFRILIWHFNWFMAILLIVATVLVGAIMRLDWLAGDQGVVDTKDSSSTN